MIVCYCVLVLRGPGGGLFRSTCGDDVGRCVRYRGDVHADVCSARESGLCEFTSHSLYGWVVVSDRRLQFIVGRVLIGIGQGLALTAGSIYIGELAPQSIRGMIMSFWQMFYSVGSFIALWIVSIPAQRIEMAQECLANIRST